MRTGRAAPKTSQPEIKLRAQRIFAPRPPAPAPFRHDGTKARRDSVCNRPPATAAIGTLRAHRPAVHPGTVEPWRAPARLDEQSTWDGPAAITPASRASTRGSATDIFFRGEILGGVYEIGQLLGSGGMGQVYEAFDHHLVRSVAVKASWPWVPSRFLRYEARALAALRHPGVVSVHAAGIHRGIEYLVMERLYGLTLADHLRRRVGTASQVGVALDILIGIAEALDVVHSSGLIHRDLKPENIMLISGNRVILLDLGVCQSLQEIVAERAVRGSPHYIAPETIIGRIDPAQAHKVDIYALGVIAYELLAGRPPLDDPDPAELLRKHVSQTPPRLRASKPELSREIDLLVAEMLSKDPTGRPRSLDSLATSLRTIRTALERDLDADSKRTS